MTQGLRATLDRELDEINNHLLEMGNLVDRAIERALLALHGHDQGLAAEVIAEDAAINEKRFHVEETCLTLIATQQPIASDLRSIIAVMHSVVELERMGDHAAGIAKTVIKMADHPPVKPLRKISRMADYSRTMLKECLEAFIAHDGNKARQIASRDAEMDRLYWSVFDRLIRIMSKRSTMITQAIYLMWCAHNLERIADRVTNLAEQVIFKTTGDIGELAD